MERPIRELPYGAKLHSVWMGMRRRCTYVRHIQYQDYGGRGISVCDEWNQKNGFRNFYQWAIDNGFSEGLTIDRIDTNGNYDPANCRWVTMTVQERNRRVRSTNRFGIPGVTLRSGKKGTRYRVTICVDGKILSVGTYGSLAESLEARIQAEKFYWGFTNNYLLIGQDALKAS